MKIKRPKETIEMVSSHCVDEDDLTGEMEITSFELEFKGELTGWIEEYLVNPIESRLHKNLVRIFSDWFED